MVGLLTTVSGKVPKSCLTKAISKEGCNISLKGAPSVRLIVDFDKPGSPLAADETRCDYLFLAELTGKSDCVRPIELKRGGFDAGVVRLQLQAGAQAAEHLIPSRFVVNFLPILASGNVPKAQRKSMRFSVRFRGTDTPLRRIRSGDPLP